MKIFFLLYTFDSKHIFIDQIVECFISSHVEDYSYTMRGKLLDKHAKIIAIGDIKVELDVDLPGDAQENDFIFFSCERVDIVF